MESDIVTCPHCGKRNRVPAAAAGKPRCANCHQWLPWIAAAGDVDKAPAISQRFTVQAVPTLLLLDHGQILARQAGAAPVAALRTWLDQALSAGSGKDARS